MNFERTEERRMLADTLGRYLADNCGWEDRLKTAYDAPFGHAATWQELCELGVLAALVPEDQGGFGGAGFDVTTVFEEVGRALLAEPVLPALVAARLLMAAGGDVAPLVSGEVRYAVAFAEVDGSQDPLEVETSASSNGSGWRLNGRKTVVYGGHIAERFLVTARAGDGIGLFEVEAGEAEVAGYGMIDGGGAAEVILDGAQATLLIEDAESAVADALDHGALALCAEAVGALDHVFDVTLDYLKTRKQFGRTLGSFQALQHRMVDLKTEIEQARSITILAASRMGAEDQSRTVSMAKSLIGKTAVMVAEEAIQLHGGIAMTWEHPVSHYAKRLVMIDHQLGDTDYHLSRVMTRYRDLR